jgi:ATP-binding cassette, subfamily B (MDR/TAP), member 1
VYWEEGEVGRKEMEEACRAALIHRFVRELLEGYETMLEVGEAALGGGQ